MRKVLLATAIIAIFSLLVGCQGIKLNTRTDSPIEPVETTPEPIVPKTAAQGVFDEAKAHFSKGQDLIEVGNYDEGKAELDGALRLALSDFDRENDKKAAARIDALFVEICLSQVRIAHLRGGFVKTELEESPLGLVYNPEVERWLSYFLTTGRRSMETYLSRASEYSEMMDRVLESKNVPTDLKYLPIIESGYSPYAYSPAHAAGIWQFIRATGKRYGLQIDAWVDERRDPEKATGAAADYLGELYGMFNSWPLALASYNCGEGRVMREVKSKGVTDYRALSLPGETCDYVPKFYAALMIAREPEIYGFFVQDEEPLRYEVVRLEKPADLKKIAAITSVSYEELKALNPELLSHYTHPKKPGYDLKVPLEYHGDFLTAFNAASDGEKYLSTKQVAQLKAPRGGGGKVVYHRVKKGESLWTIAKKYKTTVSVIKKYNRAARAKYLKPGVRLKIYRGRKR
jgi:peptidoglycan lytic transglycosylase D